MFLFVFQMILELRLCLYRTPKRAVQVSSIWLSLNTQKLAFLEDRFAVPK